MDWHLFFIATETADWNQRDIQILTLLSYQLYLILDTVATYSKTQKHSSENYSPGLLNLLRSSVSIVSGYGLDDRAIEVWSPAEAKGFFL
jgi:hypothetical protein